MAVPCYLMLCCHVVGLLQFSQATKELAKEAHLKSTPSWLSRVFSYSPLVMASLIACRCMLALK